MPNAYFRDRCLIPSGSFVRTPPLNDATMNGDAPIAKVTLTAGRVEAQADALSNSTSPASTEPSAPSPDRTGIRRRRDEYDCVVLRRAPLFLGDEIRIRHRLAEFLPSRLRPAPSKNMRTAPGSCAHRSALRALRCASRARLSGRAAADGPALLHERNRAGLRARGGLTVDMSLSRRPGVAWRTDAAPPRARAEPAGQTAHGVTLTDDYAWMRAENWQQVLAQPEALPPDIRAHLEAENAYADAMLADTAALKETITRELRGRIKEDDAEPPLPDGPVRLLHALSHGRAASARLPADARRRRGANAPRCRQGGRRPRFLPHRCGHPFARPCAARLERRRQGIGIRTASAAAISRPGATATMSSSIPTDPSSGWRTAARFSTSTSTTITGRQKSSAMSSAPIRRTMLLVVEETDPRWFINLKRSASGRFGIVSMHDHDASEVWLDRSARCIRARAPRLRPRAAPALRSRASRRCSADPHQRRRRGGFQDRLRSARDARSCALARCRARTGAAA